MNTLAIVLTTLSLHKFCTIETTQLNFSDCFTSNFQCMYETYIAMNQDNRSIPNKIEFAKNVCID